MTYQQRLQQARAALQQADHVIIGGGAGLSAAAGLTYSGERFTEHFAPFIKRYGMQDMYTSSFYPFATDEERWAYWAVHIHVNRYLPPALPLYADLLQIVGNRSYFVITTNVDHQFLKAGFPAERVFAVQGDYGLCQCAKGCHPQVYENEALVHKLLAERTDCTIPTALVPHCTVCGGPMDVNLRKDRFFVQDAAWDAASERYSTFLRTMRGRVVFLELGVGFNTPDIIRFPFEQMTYDDPQATLIRMNAHHPAGPKENTAKTIAFTEDMAETVRALLGSNS